MTRLDRMRALVAGSGSTPSVVHTASPGESRLERATSALGGVVEMDTDGPCLLVRRRYDGTARYGRQALGTYPRPEAAALGVVGGGVSPTDAWGRRALYFDLETTGLSGGAGTVAFLVGCGWFDADGFHTEQYFLPTLTAESRMLRAVARRLAQATTLVTFNGKSFDVPITDARFAFHRLSSPLSDLCHVDLLHPARRLWSEAETRLVGLERAVLGLRRQGDVPGGEIPTRYVAYLRSGDPRGLSAILEHNRLDLVSLGLLTGLACALTAKGAVSTRSATQALGLGRLYEKVGRWEDAIACYRRAEDATAPAPTRAAALRRLAVCHRRDRRHAAAAAAWQALLAMPGVPTSMSREAHLALAVYHEHRSRDLVQAERLAVRALAREAQPRQRQALEHRVRRITRKRARQQDAEDSSATLLRVPER